MHRVLLIILLCLTGCAHPFVADAEQDDDFTYVLDSGSEGGNPLPPIGAVNTLTDQIAAELMRNLNATSGVNLLAVTTPVNINDYQSSSDLGRQYGSALLTSLHRQGFRVMDLNGSDVVRVTEEGNFLLSRDFERLSESALVSHILVATLGYNKEGVQIYSRILQLTDNSVVSASRAEVVWQALPGQLQPSRQVNLRDGMLHRDAQQGEGEVILWNR